MWWVRAITYTHKIRNKKGDVSMYYTDNLLRYQSGLKKMLVCRHLTLNKTLRLAFWKKICFTWLLRVLALNVMFSAKVGKN